jgi:hypothetical protein
VSSDPRSVGLFGRRSDIHHNPRNGYSLHRAVKPAHMKERRHRDRGVDRIVFLEDAHLDEKRRDGVLPEHHGVSQTHGMTPLRSMVSVA